MGTLIPIHGLPATRLGRLFSQKRPQKAGLVSAKSNTSKKQTRAFSANDDWIDASYAQSENFGEEGSFAGHNPWKLYQKIISIGAMSMGYLDLYA